MKSEIREGAVKAHFHDSETHQLNSTHLHNKSNSTEFPSLSLFFFNHSLNCRKEKPLLNLQRAIDRTRCVRVTINPARLSPPSPPLAEVGQTRAEGIKSKEGSLYLALAGYISPHQCVGDQ